MKPVSKEYINNNKKDHHSARDEERERLRADKSDKKRIKANNKGKGKKAWEDKMKKMEIKKVEMKIRSILHCNNPNCEASYINKVVEVHYDWEDTLICPQCGSILTKKSPEYIKEYESHLQ
jgi:hypothetical protein